jgi:hypothetical protein
MAMKKRGGGHGSGVLFFTLRGEHREAYLGRLKPPFRPLLRCGLMIHEPCGGLGGVSPGKGGRRGGGGGGGRGGTELISYDTTII